MPRPVPGTDSLTPVRGKAWGDLRELRSFKKRNVTVRPVAKQAPDSAVGRTPDQRFGRSEFEFWSGLSSSLPYRCTYIKQKLYGDCQDMS